MNIKVKDSRPQVGIFEIVDNVFLMHTEDVQQVSETGRYFDGYDTHFHNRDIKTLVKYNPHISEETKSKFESNANEYLNYPRGRVDYDTETKQFSIMAATKFFTAANVERVTREFHLPPYASGKIVLEGDNGHYDY